MPDTPAITIDGPVASGKTVVGRLVAQRLGFMFLDTGAMYRAVTWVALQKGVQLEHEASLVRLADALKIRLAGERLLADGEDITDQLKEPEVEHGVSLVARVPGVRKALVRQQRAMAMEGAIVVVGRDIGTIVLPSAAVKVYLTASVEVRAQRRFEELQRRGDRVAYAQVVNELIRRDKIDSERADSPLRPADDAVPINTDHLTIDELTQKILCLVERD